MNVPLYKHSRIRGGLFACSHANFVLIIASCDASILSHPAVFVLRWYKADDCYSDRISERLTRSETNGAWRSLDHDRLIELDLPRASAYYSNACRGRDLSRRQTDGTIYRRPVSGFRWRFEILSK